MTPMTMMSAITPTVTPPAAITVMSENTRSERRLRRYRDAIVRSTCFM